MRFIVKVSVSVLSFMVFQTGSCMNASFARAFHVARQGVNAGETREVVIQKALTAYEESKGKQAAAVPVRPAPAPAPAPVQPALVEVLVSQSAPSAPSVNVPVVASTSASTPIQQPVPVQQAVPAFQYTLPEVLNSDYDEAGRSIGSCFFDTLRSGGSAESTEAPQRSFVQFRSVAVPAQPGASASGSNEVSNEQVSFEVLEIVDAQPLNGESSALSNGESVADSEGQTDTQSQVDEELSVSEIVSVSGTEDASGATSDMSQSSSKSKRSRSRRKKSFWKQKAQKNEYKSSGRNKTRKVEESQKRE